VTNGAGFAKRFSPLSLPDANRLNLRGNKRFDSRTLIERDRQNTRMQRRSKIEIDSGAAKNDRKHVLGDKTSGVR
jgi:hypothetical protein